MHRLEMQNRSIPSDIHSFGTEKDSLEAPLIDPVSDVPRSPVKAPHRVLPALLCVVAGIMVFVGGLYMQGRPYADPCVGFEFTICEYTGCYTAKEFFGTLFAILAIPGTLIPIGNFAQAVVSRYRNGQGDALSTRILLLSCVVIFGVFVVLAWLLLLKPWAIFPSADGTSGGYGHGWNHYGIMELFFGGIVTVVFPALMIVFGYVANRLWTKADSKSQLTRPPRPLETSKYPGAFCTLILVLLVAMFATFFFSPVINYSPQSYFPFLSPFSLVNATAGKHFTSKVFEDVLIYYGMIIFIVLAGAAAHLWRPARSILHKRLRVPGNPGWPYHPFPHGVSVGELILIAACITLYAVWLWFWRFKYTRIETEAALDKHRLLHIWARVFGHFTNLSFSLLLLPAARNSMWVSCFGVPFERAVKYHRFLGAIAYMTVTVHMLIWFVKWGMEGSLLNNMFNIHELRIGDTVWIDRAHCVGFYPHWDNFTVVLTWLGWLVLSVMVYIAAVCRRKNYELFHYVHMFAWVYYLIALLHAWTFWYYASGGLMLYLVDRCIRLSRSCTCTAIVSLDHVDGVSVLHVSSGMLNYFAGQYAFVNVPAISELEWHPFTISSPPSAPELSFHIKNMGEGTWTGELATLAQAAAMTEVRIDGPYGKPNEFSDKSVLVLVAGGIGITPMHSLFAELYAQACRSGDGVSGIGRIRAVHLIWSSRSDAMFCMFASIIHAVAVRNPSNIFHVHLYNSMPAVSGESSIGDVPQEAVDYTRSRITRGRPKLGTFFQDIRRVVGSGSEVMVMACGPESMVLDASEHAFKFDFGFHTEIFMF